MSQPILKSSTRLRRRLLLGLASVALAAPLALQAQTQTQTQAKVIRIGAPDFGVAGKPSPGGGILAIVQHNKWLEEEFAKDGIKVEWNFFRGAGPAVAEALAAKQLDLVSLYGSITAGASAPPPTSRASNAAHASCPGTWRCPRAAPPSRSSTRTCRPPPHLR